MSLHLPPSSSILAGMLAEIDNGIIPTLTDSRSSHMARLSSYMLRVLVGREHGLDAILREGLAKSAALLGEACQSTSSLAGPALLNAYDAMSRKLEARIEGCKDTEWVRSAVALEAALIEAVDAAAQDPSMGVPTVPAKVTPEMLNAYFARELPGKGLVAESVRSVGFGISKDTFLVQLAQDSEWGRELIVRRDVPFGTVDTSVVDEFPLFEKLAAAGFPTPQPLWLERGKSELVAPFAIVAKVGGEVAGRVGTEGPSKLILTEGARECGPEFARVIAQLHKLDLAKLGYSAELLARPTSEHIRQQLRHTRAYWKSRRLAPSAILAAAFDWMEAHVPTQAARTSLVHGDPTPRNFMIDQGRITALLDWETAHLGDPAEDLYFARLEMSQVMPWEDFLAAYYKAGGPEFRTDSEDFYALWSILRNTAWAAACLHGGVAEKTLDIRWSFTGTFYYYTFLKQIAQFLATH